mmetsp:Transcript_41090/g.87511  ORF Transcript_41090/g.87511 Transcript_41090/m.87511 type:complete len:433 (-) Transcript_41090:55-1353(-)
MIIYDNGQWMQVVCTYAGSVWPSIRMPFAVWVAWVLASFFLTSSMHQALGTDGHTTLGSTMAFLLIFRANQAYARYWEGRSCTTMFFADLREIIINGMMYIHGGTHTEAWLSGDRKKVPDDKLDVKASQLRVDLVRLIVAFAVILKMYTRVACDGYYCFGRIDRDTKWLVDWDRLRLRQLLKEGEFRAVDSCLGISEEDTRTETAEALASRFREWRNEGPPDAWPEFFEVDLKPAARVDLAIVYIMREVLLDNMDDFQNTIPWGIKERFIPIIFKLLATAQANFEGVNKIISTPLPLPYACLCKTLVCIWMASFPFIVDYQLGYFGSIIIPSLVGLALFGIDAISTELENPFGDDANDLDLVELIHNLEGEAMHMLTLCGDDKARACFVWRRMPAFVAETSSKPVRHQLATAELALEEVASPMSTPASSHRN